MRDFENQSDNLKELMKVGNYLILILDEWHNRIGGGIYIDSFIDRIIHDVYEIPTNETNLRKLYDSKKLKRLVDEIES